MHFQQKHLAILITSILSQTTAQAETLQPITVNADLRNATIQSMPASVNIQTANQLNDEGARNYEDILLKTPNVNYSGQSSRPRHIQIRGIGERDEYTGAPNPSVGFAIDGIDFSGIGMTGNLFDAKQVEVLRGPQSTRYGANALAGLINIQTNDPQKKHESMIEATGGQDNLKELGIMTTGAFSQKTNSPQYRIAIQGHHNDGFRHNAYLGRNDTNQRNEVNARAKLRFFPSEHTTLDLTFLHADLNNSYDAWALNNSLTTQSDQPGKDTQLSNAGALKLVHKTPNYTLTSQTALANSDMVYSYDGDWAYPGYHSSGDNTYFYQNLKNRKSLTQDLRLASTKKTTLFNHSTDWLIGIFGSKLTEDNHTTDNYGANTISQYDMIKLASYGQLDTHFSNNWTLSTGLRIENDGSTYSDNNNENYHPNETLWGGSISLSKQLSPHQTAYASISRGYKAGGFNVGLPTNQSNLTHFNSESLINYEIGHKTRFANGKLKTQIAIFYMDRTNPQLDGYTYVGNNYVFYKENFDKATHYGLEASINWKPKPQYQLFAALGLLTTEVQGTSASQAFTISNRALPHSPGYQFNIGGQYNNDKGFFIRAEAQGMDAFYFSDSNNAKSTAYTLYNARIGYEGNDWEVALWGKNLTDERYATRGFYFANEPTYSIEQKYIHLGDPRQFGITAKVYF